MNTELPKFDPNPDPDPDPDPGPEPDEWAEDGAFVGRAVGLSCACDFGPCVGSAVGGPTRSSSSVTWMPSFHG